MTEPITATSDESRATPLNIAHRGASGHAPEHTLAAYRLAVEMGADFVEQDLQVTRDGVLVCLHDADLARTTDVEERFPDRATMRDPGRTGTPVRGWFVADFTLAEIKTLDAGSWFNRANPFAARPEYARERIPTLAETAAAVAARAGLYIELKHFEYYRSLGHDTAAKLAATLAAAGFDTPARRPTVFVQSFSKAGLLAVRERAPGYRRVQLLPIEDVPEDQMAPITPAFASRIAAYAQGVGPSRSMLSTADDVRVLQTAGLLVHPYTFRGATTAVTRQPLDERLPDGRRLHDAIVDDIRRFVALGIDGGFTDYPDLWREAVAPAAPKDPAAGPRRP